MKNKIKALEKLLLKLKMETYINRKSSRIYDEELEALESTIKILKNKINHRLIGKKGGTRVEYTSKPIPPPPVHPTLKNEIKAIEEYIKQLEHDIQIHRSTDREYAKCLEQKLSGVNTVYYMIKNN